MIFTHIAKQEARPIVSLHALDLSYVIPKHLCIGKSALGLPFGLSESRLARARRSTHRLELRDR